MLGMLGTKWVQVLSVVVGLEWPSMPATTATCAPSSAMMVARECLRSWNRTRGSPAASKSLRR